MSKITSGRFPRQTAFPTVTIFFSFAQPASVYCEEYVHISDCIQSVYELLLLPNFTARETFLYKSVAVGSVDWIFIIGAPT